MQPGADPHDASARIGRYEVLRKIATGGMAELFLAKQVGMEGFEKVVAIKRILSHLAFDEEFIAMFRDEARLVAKLNHPNIVQIYDLGKSGDSYFIAMEYIPGRNLSSVAKKARALGRRLPPIYLARCVAQACEGLYYAHTRQDMNGSDLQIIHRDVSPQNIIVSFSGSVKLVDFGIAKAASKVAQTRAGVLKGKYAYMSPEQIRGEPIDARSDLFAVGIVLYELLCGRRPFEKDNSIQTLKAIVQDEPVPARHLNPDIPLELAEIIDRCLAKDRLQRFASAQEVQLALEDLVTSSPERCNNITISNWLADLFQEELSREKGATVVFKGVGEVILPEVGDGAIDASDRAARPPIPAPSNALLDRSRPARLLDEAPIGHELDLTDDPFTDERTHFTGASSWPEHPEPELDRAQAAEAYPDDATAFAPPPSATVADDDDRSGEASVPPILLSWEASTVGAVESEPEPADDDDGPWAASGSSSTGGQLDGPALERTGGPPRTEYRDDATVAMATMLPEEAEAAELLGPGWGQPPDEPDDLEELGGDRTLALSVPDPEVGDATVAMSAVSEPEPDEALDDRTLGGAPFAGVDHDDVGDRTLGGEELAAMFGGPREGASIPAGSNDGPGSPSTPTPMTALGEEHTVRAMDDEPSLPGGTPPRPNGYDDDRTMAGVTSDFGYGADDQPASVEDRRPPGEEDDLLASATPHVARPRSPEGGEPFGAIALEKQAFDSDLDAAFEAGADDVLIDPELDLDFEPSRAAAPPRGASAQEEYSALVGGRPGRSVGSLNVPPAGLSMNELLAQPMTGRAGSGDPPRVGSASGARMQALPRAQPSIGRVTASRSYSGAGRQIREVVRTDGTTTPPPSFVDGTPAPAPVDPAAFEDLPPEPSSGTPPAEAVRGRSIVRRVLAGLAVVMGVLSLSAATYFVLPFVLPSAEPNLTIRTDPAGATVKVNGAAQAGRTPLRITDLTPGVSYRVQLDRDGYRSVAQDVTLPPDRPLLWKINLVPASESP